MKKNATKAAKRGITAIEARIGMDVPVGMAVGVKQGPKGETLNDIFHEKLQKTPQRRPAVNMDTLKLDYTGGRVGMRV